MIDKKIENRINASTRLVSDKAGEIKVQNERYAELTNVDFSLCREMGSLALRPLFADQFHSYVVMLGAKAYIPEYDSDRVEELSQRVTEISNDLDVAAAERDKYCVEIDKLSKVAKGKGKFYNSDVDVLASEKRIRASEHVQDLQKSLELESSEIRMLKSGKNAYEIFESLHPCLLTSDQVTTLEKMQKYSASLYSASNEDVGLVADRNFLFLQPDILKTPSMSFYIKYFGEKPSIFEVLQDFFEKTDKVITFETIANQIKLFEATKRVGMGSYSSFEFSMLLKDELYEVELHTGWLEVEHPIGMHKMTRVYSIGRDGEEWVPPVYKNTVRPGKYVWDDLLTLEQAPAATSEH